MINKPRPPALFITTQTTIPVLTTALFAFSLVMIDVGTGNSLKSEEICLPSWQQTATCLWQFKTTDAAYALLGIAAVAFLFSTQACVQSHAWDYYSIPAEQRAALKLSVEESYIKECTEKSENWHRWAILSYRVGILCGMYGVGFLFWSVSKIVSILTASYGTIIVIIGLCDSLIRWQASCIRKRQA